jgi:hypothetical protein
MSGQAEKFEFRDDKVALPWRHVEQDLVMNVVSIPSEFGSLRMCWSG